MRNTRLQLFPLLRVAIVLIVGIFLGDALGGVVQVEVWQWLFLTMTTLMALSFVVCRRMPMVQSLLLIFVVVVCGSWRYAFCASQMDVDYISNDEYYEAVVAARPLVKPRSIKTVLLVTKGRLAGHQINAYFDKQSGAERLIVGDGLQMVSRLDNPVMSTNLSKTHFDYKRWLQVHDIVASTFVGSDNWQSEVVDMKSLSALQRYKIFFGRLREYILKRVSSRGFEDSVYSIIVAMSLGDKSSLSKDMRETYSVVGVSHVLALSGMHLGVIYALLSLLLLHRRFGLWQVMLGNIVILLAIWTYAVMVGGQTSIMRSAIMFTIITISNMLRSYNVSLNTFGMTLLIMLYANPLSLWDVGFQMSFLAVFGILMCNERLCKISTPKWLLSHKFLSWCWNMTKVSVAAQLSVAPLVMFYFGRFSCYFLIANFVAIPLATAIVCFSLLYFIMSPIGWLADFVATVLQYLATAMNTSMELMASLPGASIENVYINKIQLVSLYVVLTALYMLSYYAERFYRIEKGYSLKTYKYKKL